MQQSWEQSPEFGRCRFEFLPWEIVPGHLQPAPIETKPQLELAQIFPSKWDENFTFIFPLSIFPLYFFNEKLNSWRDISFFLLRFPPEGEEFCQGGTEPHRVRQEKQVQTRRGEAFPCAHHSRESRPGLSRAYHSSVLFVVTS